MPDEPPWTSSVSPAARRPRSNTLCQTVKNVSGSAAASSIENPRGTGRHSGSAATAYSAYPPPGSSAQTASPSRQRRAVTDDVPRDLEAGDVRGARRRRVLAQPLEHVRTVHAGGRHADEHLARARRGQRTTRRAQHLGAARARDLDDDHLVHATFQESRRHAPRS